MPNADQQTDRLRCIAVHCRNVAEGLQTIMVLYGACGASSAPGAIAEHYNYRIWL